MKPKFFVLVLFITLSTCINGNGQQISKSERKKSMDLLKESLDQVQQLTKRLSKNQYNFKPAANRWSILNNIDHLIKVEEIVWDIIQKSLKSSGQGQQSDINDEEFIAKLSTRHVNYSAPSVLKPEESKYQDMEEAMKAFKRVRVRTIKFVKKSKADLRHHFAPNPVFGNLDTYQWTLHAAAHSIRHIEQIEEILAHENFPK